MFHGMKCVSCVGEGDHGPRVGNKVAVEVPIRRLRERSGEGGCGGGAGKEVAVEVSKRKSRGRADKEVAVEVARVEGITGAVADRNKRPCSQTVQRCGEKLQADQCILRLIYW